MSVDGADIDARDGEEFFTPILAFPHQGGRDFFVALTLSPLPEGEGTLWAADGGVFALADERVGEDGGVVGGGGLGELH